jgi:hypothetical protein
MIDFTSVLIWVANSNFDHYLRGDLNANYLKYEISDAELYAKCFVLGLSAFEAHVDYSVVQSDVRSDGIPLELRDLQYLIRIIVGDAKYDRLIGDTTLVQISAFRQDDQVLLQSTGADSIGLVLFTLTGASLETTPIVGPGVGKMKMIYGQSADTLKILIYAIDKLWIGPGKSELVRIPYAKSLHFESAKLIDYWGGYIRTEITGISEK